MDEIEKLKWIIELQRGSINRWVPCPDHRDKTTKGICYVCENQRLRELIKRLVKDPDNAAVRASVQREIEDGRAFK